MDIPHFIKIAHDEQARTAVLSVEDQNVTQQKEMWGGSFTSPTLAKAILQDQQ